MATILGNIKKDNCRVTGGIKQIYIMEYDSGSYNPQYVGGEVTALNIDSNPSDLYLIETNPGQSSATENIEFDMGVHIVSQEATIVLNNLSKEELDIIQSYGVQCVLFVQFNTGRTVMFGIDNYLDPTSVEVTRGTGLSDGHSVTLQYSGKEYSLAPCIKGSELGDPLGILVQGVDYNLTT